MKIIPTLCVLLATAAMTIQALNTDLRTLVCEASKIEINLNNLSDMLNIKTCKPKLNKPVVSLFIEIKQKARLSPMTYELNPKDAQSVKTWIEALKLYKIISIYTSETNTEPLIVEENNYKINLK